jgi:hypothetical protein
MSVECFHDRLFCCFVSYNPRCDFHFIPYYLFGDQRTNNVPSSRDSKTSSLRRLAKRTAWIKDLNSVPPTLNISFLPSPGSLVGSYERRLYCRRISVHSRETYSVAFIFCDLIAKMAIFAVCDFVDVFHFVSPGCSLHDCRIAHIEWVARTIFAVQLFTSLISRAM